MKEVINRNHSSELIVLLSAGESVFKSAQHQLIWVSQ